ncbi:hypothetical protein [Gimesia chilikensis]|uniref:hypothetical protein n=1 Tax=Gimesia chilikensis TaxID=2605989 RepID=UPI0018D5EE05|nr:hypothetical protein [Gimesia chilikensis]
MGSFQRKLLGLMELSSFDAVFDEENMREVSEPGRSASLTVQPDIAWDTDWRFE